MIWETHEETLVTAQSVGWMAEDQGWAILTGLGQWASAAPSDEALDATLLEEKSQGRAREKQAMMTA
ncbi:unnamed protein product [Clonostachys rhizophaga]|uniref:Uncharacterized protein n=1 Tax=Clonostachys rhizophaga TaxID=160324 RepID=A0A9N9YB02_9HYPO|nr:unnamed protein product [Clonostachys rhizophaga]